MNNFEEKDLLKKFLDFRKAEERPFEEYDKTIDKIIYYGILLDSFGFHPSNKERWTYYDKFAAEKISSEQ